MTRATGAGSFRDATIGCADDALDVSFTAGAGAGGTEGVGLATGAAVAPGAGVTTAGVVLDDVDADAVVVVP